MTDPPIRASRPTRLLGSLLHALRRVVGSNDEPAAPAGRATPQPPAGSRHLGSLFGLATDLVVGGFDIWSLVGAAPRSRKSRAAAEPRS